MRTGALLMFLSLALLACSTPHGGQLHQASQPTPVAEPERSWGELTVYAKPKGEVVINGVMVAMTPDYTRRLATGEHEVWVKWPDQTSVRKRIQVREGAELKLFFKTDGGDPEKAAVEETPYDVATGTLVVYSKPIGEVIVDGSEVGASAPLNHTLEVGRHDVQLKWPDGRLSGVRRIQVRKDSEFKLFFRDRSKDRRPERDLVYTSGLMILTEPWGELKAIYVDSKQVASKTGTAPLRLGDLTPGVHTIEVEWQDGERSKPQEVEIVEGSSTRVFFCHPKRPSRALKARRRANIGRLDVTSIPVGATIVVDDYDTRLKTPMMKHHLPVGDYTIRLTWPDGTGTEPKPIRVTQSGSAHVHFGPDPASVAGAGRGLLSVRASSPGVVLVEGKEIAAAPLRDLRLEEGVYEVHVLWDNGTLSEAKTIRLREGEATELVFLRR